MVDSKNKLQERFEKWVEWKLYKILYIGILVPFLLGESRKWLLQDFGVAVVFFISAIILLLPTLFKILNILDLIGEFE